MFHSNSHSSSEIEFPFSVVCPSRDESQLRTWTLWNNFVTMFFQPEPYFEAFSIEIVTRKGETRILGDKLFKGHSLVITDTSVTVHG